MHDSHKFWMMAAVFLVIMGLLVGMYITATPKKMAPVIKKEMPEEIVNAVNGKTLKKTIVAPYINVKSDNVNNIIYCLAFQLAWDELGTIMNGDPILYGNPYTAVNLNKHIGGKNDISEGSYISVSGFAKDGTADKIYKMLEEKFNDKPRFPLSSSEPETILSYAHLYKNLRFENGFYALPFLMNFNGENVKVFGFENIAADPEISAPAQLLYYVNDGEFAINLTSLSEKDEIIFAKTLPDATLEKTVSKISSAIANRKQISFSEGDMIIIPEIDFDIVKSYGELTNKKFLNENFKKYHISEALQAIKLKLDSEYDEIKIEALVERGMGFATESIDMEHKEQKQLVFNKPFLLMFIKKGAKQPYFAAWFNNAEMFVKE